MGKYARRKYFYSKSEIVKTIFAVLFLGGAIAVASTSPYFITNLIKGFDSCKKYKNKKVYDTFYRLKKKGLITFDKSGSQIYFKLTEEGKKAAGWLQVDSLKIKKPKKWDGKWRIVIFDIAEMKRIYREAFRSKLKELGFLLFQKSAWIFPYDCKKEMAILREFFGLKDYEMKLITAQDIGDDSEYKKIFTLGISDRL